MSYLDILIVIYTNLSESWTYGPLCVIIVLGNVLIITIKVFKPFLVAWLR